MQNRDQLVTAGDAVGRFNFSNSTGHVGDQVHVFIQLKTYSRTSVIDPYVTQVISRDEAFHSAVAWVDVNMLEEFASVDDVRSIAIIIPPVTTQLADITVIRGHSFGTDMAL